MVDDFLRSMDLATGRAASKKHREWPLTIQNGTFRRADGSPTEAGDIACERPTEGRVRFAEG